MANIDLNAVSTYADDAQLDVLKKAAGIENRSLSNYLLTCGLEVAAREHGIRAFGLFSEKSARK